MNTWYFGRGRFGRGLGASASGMTPETIKGRPAWGSERDLIIWRWRCSGERHAYQNQQHQDVFQIHEDQVPASFLVELLGEKLPRLFRDLTGRDDVDMVDEHLLVHV